MPKSRPATLIIVGTSHTVQTTDAELGPFLKSLCQEFKVHAVAEEMNEEALAEKCCAASIPMQVASALKLPHRFCDPNRKQRTKLQIHQENDIRISAFPSTLPETEVAARLAESHARREQYWLEQLRKLNSWPVLFVCGADHVASFRRLLEQEGISVRVAADDWASNMALVRTRREPASMFNRRAAARRTTPRVCRAWHVTTQVRDLRPGFRRAEG